MTNEYAVNYAIPAAKCHQKYLNGVAYLTAISHVSLLNLSTQRWNDPSLRRALEYAQVQRRMSKETNTEAHRRGKQPSKRPCIDSAWHLRILLG